MRACKAMVPVVLASWALVGASGCGRQGPREAHAEGPTAPVADAGAPAEAPDGEAEAGARTANRRPSEAEQRSGEIPEGPAALYQAALIEGDAALASGRFEEARDRYYKAMELRPTSMAPALGAIRALRLRGRGEERAELERRARRTVAEYLRQPQTRGAAHLLSARLAIALDRTGEALDKARLAVELLPELGVAWRVLGEAAMEAEAWREAVAALRKATTLGLLAAPGTWERLADALDELGDLAGAEEAAQEALRLTGADPHARRRRLNVLAVILKHGGRLEEALKAVREARILGPDDPTVLHNLGSIQQAQGQPERAVATYRKALALAPVPMTSWRLGHTLLALDRPSDALQAFTFAAARLDRWSWPNSTRWWPAYEVAKLYARGGRYDTAIGWFEDALREARTPDASREIRSWLAYVRSRGDP